MADILDVRFEADERAHGFRWDIIGLFGVSALISGFAIYGVFTALSSIF